MLVPRAGLVVDKENVRFENIDFVWRQAPAAGDAKTAEPAVVQLRASRAEFRGCSFQCEEMGLVPVSAIRWVHPARADDADTSLPSGRLQLTDCLLRRVGAGLDCRTVGALAIELKNLLHLDAGPLVRLDHCPRSDEAVSIVLAQVTLRGGGPLLECFLPRVEQQPGEMAVLATACAFVPDAGVPLVRLTGAELPERLLGAMRWSGQGSLVPPRTADHRLARVRTAETRPSTNPRWRSPAWCEAKWALPAPPRAIRPPAGCSAGKRRCNRPIRPASIPRRCRQD